MSDKNCTRCETELTAVKQELDEVKTERHHLRQLLAAVAGHCESQAHNSAGEMSRGGLGAARYSELKGKNLLANEVLKILGEPEIIKKGGGYRGTSSRNRNRRHSSLNFNRLFNAVVGFWRNRYARR